LKENRKVRVFAAGLVEGTIDCGLDQGGMLPLSLADGISIAVVLPRESTSYRLLAAAELSRFALEECLGLIGGGERNVVLQSLVISST